MTASAVKMASYVTEQKTFIAKDIHCKSVFLNAEVLCEDKRVTDILIFFGAPSETVRTRILKKLTLRLTASKVLSDKRSVQPINP